jgi:hypothetical protein
VAGQCSHGLLLALLGLALLSVPWLALLLHLLLAL